MRCSLVDITGGPERTRGGRELLGAKLKDQSKRPNVPPGGRSMVATRWSPSSRYRGVPGNPAENIWPKRRESGYQNANNWRVGRSAAHPTHPGQLSAVSRTTVDRKL